MRPWIVASALVVASAASGAAVARAAPPRTASPMSTPPPARRYDANEVSRLYFFPRATAALPRTPTAGPVPLALRDGTRLGGYWSRPLPKAPTILYLYGNGETASDQLGRWPAWAQRAGANVFFVDYPGYGTSAGKPSLSGASEAAEKALDYLLSRPASEVPSVIVVGRSAGSIFALHAAASRNDPRVRGLLLESGVADVKQRFEQRLAGHPERDAVLAELARDFDHEAKVKRLGVPLLVLHTKNDQLVPSWHAEKLASWAGTRPVLFARGGHNDIQSTNAEEYQKALGAFVTRVSGPAPARVP